MNSIEVIGGSKSRKEMATKVVGWYLKKTMPRMRTLDITIKLTNCFAKDNSYGYCLEGANNREFEIEIDKNLRDFDFVATLCHELTHLKQYAKGELVHKPCGRMQWKRSTVSEKTKYDDLPWEKEAFKMERELALECFEAVL